MESYALSMGLYNDPRWRKNAKKEMQQRFIEETGLTVEDYNKLDDTKLAEYARDYKIPFVANGRPNKWATEAAQKLHDGYFTGFPQLKEWRERSRQTVKETGRIKNYVGRIRHIPKVQNLYNKVGDRMMDWRFRKELEVQVPPKHIKKDGEIVKTVSPRDQVTQAYRDYRNGLNNCLNFQLQSLAAAVVNRAALQINRKAKELGIDAIVQAQVHDQLIINVDEKDAEMFAPYVQELMENTTKLPGVTLKAPPEIADNWKEGH